MSPVWGLLQFSTFGQLTPRDASPCCVCLPHSFILTWLLSPFPSSFFSLCGPFVVLVLDFLTDLDGLALLLWLPYFRSLTRRTFFFPLLYVVILCFALFVFCFLVFSSESLPGDDVLCRLLSRPLPSVCFLPCLFLLFCFLLPCSFPVCFGVTSSIL